MRIERVAPAAQAVVILLFTSVFFAALSMATHSHWHSLSHVFRAVAIGLSFFTLLRILNHVSCKLFMARGVHWLHAMSHELLALLAVLVLRCLIPVLPRPERNLGSGAPILLVHGYCNHSCVWTYIQRHLLRHTDRPIYTINLGYPFRSMNAYAEQVKERIAKIRQETGSKPVTLVGHSMGGVISSLVALQEKGVVSHVITIGSPMKGTHVAKIGIGANAREMQRASQLLLDLNKALEKETKVQFYHIGTKTDQLIIPGHSALLGRDPEREFLFEDIGHASLLFSPRVAQLLVHWLGTPKT